MKKLLSQIVLSTVVLGLCAHSSMAQQGDYIYKNQNLPIGERVADLVSHMTLEEKISQLSHLAPAIERLGVIEYGPVLDNPLNQNTPKFIPDVEKYRKLRPWENHEHWNAVCLDGGYWNEALHGVARSGLATVFPQQIGMGSSWNPELMQEVANAISDEARVHNIMYGRKLTYWSPTINLLRDPRWGRTEESYSEDPYLVSEMATAFVKGFQGDNRDYLKAIATIKHFVANNSEVNRHNGSSDVPERQLREYYFPPYKAAIQQGGAYSLMGAYNKVNGTPACANDWLLNDVLRKEWGFQGFVVSDCGAINDLVHEHKFETDPAKAVALAVKAGCDMECETCEQEQFLYDKYLPEAVEKGYITEDEIDIAVRHIFKARFKLGEFDGKGKNPYHAISNDVLDSEEHRSLAVEAARQSIILLKNDNSQLPLDADLGQKIAIIGPNANIAELGGYSGTPYMKITPLQGISSKAGYENIVYEQACTHMEELYPGSIEKAIQLASQADQVVLVLGTGLKMAKEGRDRTSIDLPEIQKQLLKDVYSVNKHIVLVLMNGSPLTINWAQENVPAIVEVWYPGQSGGQALADVLFGDYNPGGKLPLTIYKSVNDLPEFTNYDITKGRTYWYFKGEVLYPFGHGLSYSEFEYTVSELPAKHKMSKEGNFTFRVEVKNISNIDGDEVIQVYIRDKESKYQQAVKKLRSFKRVNVPANSSAEVIFTLSEQDFSFWNPQSKSWQIEKGEFDIQVGSSSKDIHISRTIHVSN
ncbi:MAG: glycoside hydrolase family 3 C-terminal domain-containing protein [Bacteroidota bacterium]